MFNLAQDWPMYIIMAIFFGVIAYVMVVSHRNENKEKQEKQKKEQSDK